MCIRDRLLADEQESMIDRYLDRGRMYVLEDNGVCLLYTSTSGGSGIGKTNERLAPSCKGAKLMDGKVFKGNVGHQELAAWVEGLGL